MTAQNVREGGKYKRSIKVMEVTMLGIIGEEVQVGSDTLKPEIKRKSLMHTFYISV